MSLLFRRVSTIIVKFRLITFDLSATCSRPIDVVRELDRIECEIAHYNRPDETVRTTPTLIAERLRILIPLTFPFVVDTAIRGEDVI